MTEHEKLGPMVESDSLGEVADFLEQHGHAGFAAAVRTLEYLLANGMEHLGEAILAANKALGKLGEPGMADEVSRQWSEGSTYRFHARGERVKAMEARYGVPLIWPESPATPLEDMLRMRDQIHANSIGPPMVRHIDHEAPTLGDRVILGWIEARGLADTGLRAETRMGGSIPHLEVVMRRGDKFAMRNVEEYNLARSPVVHVHHILDDLYRRLCEAELTPA